MGIRRRRRSRKLESRWLGIRLSALGSWLLKSRGRLWAAFVFVEDGGASSGRFRPWNIDEIFPIVIAEKNIRHQRAVGGIPGAQVDIEEPIVINVAKVSAQKPN